MKKLVFIGIVAVGLFGAFIISSLYANALNKKAYEEMSANSDVSISIFSKVIIKAMSLDSNIFMALTMTDEEQARAALELEDYLKENISFSFSPYESGFLHSNASFTLHFKSLATTLQGDVKFYNTPFGKRAEITLTSPELNESAGEIFKNGIFGKVSISKGFGDTKLEIAPTDIDTTDDDNALKLQGAKFSYDINNEFKISGAKLELKLFEFVILDDTESLLIKNAKSRQKYKEPVSLENIFDLSKEITSDFQGSLERIEAQFEGTKFKAENWNLKGLLTLALAKGLVSGNVTSELKSFTMRDIYYYPKEPTEILNLSNMKLELDFAKNLNANVTDKTQRTEFVLKSAEMLFDNKKIELTSDLSFAEVPAYYESTQEDIKYNLNVSSKYSVRELLERYIKEDLIDTNNEVFAIGDEIFKKDEKSGKHTLTLSLETKSLRHNPHIKINGEYSCKTSLSATLGLCPNIDNEGDSVAN